MDDNDREYVDYDDEDFGPGASLLNANLVGADLAEAFLPRPSSWEQTLAGRNSTERTSLWPTVRERTSLGRSPTTSPPGQLISIPKGPASRSPRSASSRHFR